MIDAAVNLRKGTHATLGSLGTRPSSAIDDLPRAYYLNLEVADEPGVLAAVAGVFGAHGVSIRPWSRRARGDGGPAGLHHPPRPRGRRAGHPARAARPGRGRPIGCVLRSSVPTDAAGDRR